MGKPETLKSFLSLSLAVSDTPKPITTSDVPFYEGNFHIQDYAVYYGDGSVMSAVAYANDVITFPRGNLKDIFFVNETTGGAADATVVFVGTVPTWYTDKYLK